MAAPRSRASQPPPRSSGGTARFSIGAEVFTTDGSCGELTRVIIDPVAQALTHLVVGPKHHPGLGRLVPLELVEADGDEIRLRCSAADFQRLDDAEEIHVLPASGNVWGYSGGQASAWPYYGLGMGGGLGAGMLGAGGSGLQDGPHPFVTDRVPLGEVQVRRGDHVQASDGPIGSVQGLVIDPSDHHVTHVLLQEGHLWGRKQVAIPIKATSREENEIRVKLTKQQVHDLAARPSTGRSQLKPLMRATSALRWSGAQSTSFSLRSQMMYAAIRKYRATEEPVFATQGEQEPLQLARSVDGFVGYYLVGGRDGTATAITIGQTVQTVEETTAVAPDWNVERVAHLVAGAPDVTIGEVRLQLRTSPQEQPPAMGLDMVEPTTIRG